MPGISTNRGVIKSIQKGSIAVNSATSATGTITSVVVGKSFVIYLGQRSTSSGATTDRSSFHTVELTNATTVTAERGVSAGTDWTVNYVVIEFF